LNKRANLICLLLKKSILTFLCALGNFQEYKIMLLSCYFMITNLVSSTTNLRFLLFSFLYITCTCTLKIFHLSFQIDSYPRRDLTTLKKIILIAFKSTFKLYNGFDVFVGKGLLWYNLKFINCPVACTIKRSSHFMRVGSNILPSYRNLLGCNWPAQRWPRRCPSLDWWSETIDECNDSKGSV
jgi:hypothetical protein